MLSDQSVQLKFNTLHGKTIALCVTGGIASIETIKLVREIRRYGGKVKAFMTQDAQHFITPLSLEWATCEKVITDLSGEAEHIVECDLVLAAPATLNTINKVAVGLADNVVTTTIASAWGRKIPIVFVPTMHDSLFENPVLQKNISFLKDQSHMVWISPKKEEGKEKFPNVETIVSEISHILATGPLKNKKILITGGPTQGPIDPVRYLTNFSTGELSVRLAHELYIRGAKPTLIYGPGKFPPHKFYTVISVTTPDQMLEATLSELQYQKYHAAIFSAAVLDHVPDKIVDTKLSSSEPLQVNFVQTPKIIREVDKVTRQSCENISRGLYKIGFKLEWKKTRDELISIGISALENMNVNIVVVNDLSKISKSDHEAIILSRDGQAVETNSKKEIIQTLIQKLSNAL